MDTIAAIATAPGQAGIGIIRISGPEAGKILGSIAFPVAKNREFEPWKLRYCSFVNETGQKLDNGLAVFMPGPNNFTGEDIAEFHCHGSPVIMREILAAILACGARGAEPGEFTRRAFLNGKMDLSQAEAVAEIISASGKTGARFSLNRLEGNLGKMCLALADDLKAASRVAAIGLDFPDDEIEAGSLANLETTVKKVLQSLANLLKGAKYAHTCQNGANILLTGAVNAGKSSLLNAVCGQDRALVSNVPGTTRDFLEAQIDLDGLGCNLIDTAGLGADRTVDAIEAMGMQRTRKLFAKADLIWLVLDGSRQEPANNPDRLTQEILTEAGTTPVILVWNKCDLAPAPQNPLPWTRDLPFCQVSALTGKNMAQLIRLSSQLLENCETPDALLPNLRQSQALASARLELEALLAAIRQNVPFDCCSCHLDRAQNWLEEICGINTPADILDQIFARFCIGK